VLDTPLHLRRDPDACFTHIQGCGVTNAVLLTRASDEDQAKGEMQKRPGHFVRSVATDPAQPEAADVIRKAIAGGAVSVGELKYRLALDSPEMRRVYDVCAEMQVPVMMHIQDFPHFPGELPYNTGYPQFDKILRAYPKTNFIGHGDLFWAREFMRGIPAGFSHAPARAGRTEIKSAGGFGSPETKSSELSYFVSHSLHIRVKLTMNFWRIPTATARISRSGLRNNIPKCGTMPRSVQNRHWSSRQGCKS
jgi:hypothetical protein